MNKGQEKALKSLLLRGSEEFRLADYDGKNSLLLLVGPEKNDVLEIPIMLSAKRSRRLESS